MTMCHVPGCISEVDGGALCAVHASEPTNLCLRCHGSGMVWRCGDRDHRVLTNFTDRGTCGMCAGTGLADKKARQPRSEPPAPVDTRGLIELAEKANDRG